MAGEIDLFTAAVLADGLTACLADGTPVIVVVDLRQVDFLAAAGLSVLVAADHKPERSASACGWSSRPARSVEC